MVARVQAPWLAVTEKLARGCAEAGFDLAAPLRIDAYNRLVKPPYQLPAWREGRALAVLVGNTRAFWTVFGRALHSQPGLLQHPDPVDAYTEASISRVVEGLPVRHHERFAHEPQKPVDMLRLALAAGFAHRSPSHLSVHPTIGPWFALRAVIVVEMDGPCDERCPIDVCSPCPKPCVAALRQAMQAAKDASTSPEKSVREHWRLWVAVRDACPIGRDHRYSDDQIRYHYAKDREVLTSLSRSKML